VEIEIAAAVIVNLPYVAQKRTQGHYTPLSLFFFQFLITTFIDPPVLIQQLVLSLVRYL